MRKEALRGEKSETNNHAFTDSGENQKAEQKPNQAESVTSKVLNRKKIASDNVVSFIRRGNGRYIIGGGIIILLAAYLFGVSASLISVKYPATVNPFRAIRIAFTSSGFIPFAVLMVVVIAVIALFAAVLGKGHRLTATEREFGHSNALGSGGRATSEDEEKLLIKSKSLDEQPYIVFGKKDGEWVGLNPEVDVNHFSAVCGPQQSGKSFKYVKTNLTQLAKNSQSAIIGDPKGEMYRDMSPFFEQEGYLVKQLNLFDLYASDSWNVLKDVNEDNIDLFATTFVENLSDDKEEQTFIDMKIMLFKALCLYVIYEDKDISEEEKTLGKVYEMLSTTLSEQELDDKFLPLSNSSKAKQTYMNWALGGRLKTNALATLSSKMQIFQKQALKEVTGVEDIDISLPGKQKCAYFIILDDQNQTYSCISSVFIKLLIEKAVSFAKSKANGQTDIRIHFMLDEFPTIGRIPDFKRGLGTWRGYGIDMTIIFQNIPQLMNRYPDNVWNEILAACSIQVCLGAYEDGDITAEHYAKMGGVGTIVIDSERRHLNRLNPIDARAMIQLDKTESYQQAQAIYPNEVKELILNNEMFVTIGSSKPFKFQKVGFNETKYYNMPQKPTFENIPLWLLKLKNITNFRTEYGGVYKLGRINELPERIIKLIDQWKEEFNRGSGVFISDETMPITYEAMFMVSEKVKQLNRKQGDILLQYIDKLINASTEEYACAASDKITGGQKQTKMTKFQNIRFTKTAEDEMNRTLKEIGMETAQIISGEQEKVIDGDIHTQMKKRTKELSGHGSVTTKQSNHSTLLSDGGEETENKAGEKDENMQNNPSTIKFNVTFKKKC